MKKIVYGHAFQSSSAYSSISPPITPAEGLSLLSSDAARFFSFVDSKVTVPVNHSPPSFLSHPIGTLSISLSPSTSANLTTSSTPNITLPPLSHEISPQPQLKKPLISPTRLLIYTQNQLDALVSFAFYLDCGPIPKIANFINNSRYKAATHGMLLCLRRGGCFSRTGEVEAS